MASEGPPPSNFPASMGPGAHPISPGQPDLAANARAIMEARSNYSVRVEPTELKISYSLNNQSRGFTIPFDSIPLNGASKWLLYGGSGRALVTGTFYLDMVRGAENMAGRHLTQQEAEGFALHTSKRMRYSLFGNLASIAGGIGWSALGYRQMKFPFRPVKPMESYDAFPTQKLAILRGQYARAIWQITRVNVYVLLATLFFNPFFRSLGDSVMTVGLYRDERTKDIVKEVKGGFDRIRMNRPVPGQQQQMSSPAQPSQSMEDTNAQEFYAKDSSSESYYGKSTDYSSDNSFTDSTTDTGVLSDSAMRRQEARQPPPNSFSTRATQPQSQSTSFFDDDASPTAGNDPDMSTPYRPQTSSGSAWDRIRRSPSSGPHQPTNPTTQPMHEARSWRSSRPNGQSQDFETAGDSFSFSSSDEQRALAKELAQREFDRMLDQERRESGSAEYAEDSYRTQQAGRDGAGDQSSEGQSAWGRRRR